MSLFLDGHTSSVVDPEVCGMSPGSLAPSLVSLDRKFLKLIDRMSW